MIKKKDKPHKCKRGDIICYQVFGDDTLFVEIDYGDPEHFKYLFAVEYCPFCGYCVKNDNIKKS